LTVKSKVLWSDKRNSGEKKEARTTEHMPWQLMNAAVGCIASYISGAVPLTLMEFKFLAYYN